MTIWGKRHSRIVSLPHAGKGDRAAVDRVLSYIYRLLETIPCTCQQKLDTKLKKLGIKIEYLYKIQ